MVYFNKLNEFLKDLFVKIFWFFNKRKQTNNSNCDNDIILCLDLGLGDNIIFKKTINILKNNIHLKNKKLTIIAQEKFKDLLTSDFDWVGVEFHFVNTEWVKMNDTWKNLIYKLINIKKIYSKWIANKSYDNCFIFRSFICADDISLLNNINCNKIIKYKNYCSGIESVINDCEFNYRFSKIILRNFKFNKLTYEFISIDNALLYNRTHLFLFLIMKYFEMKDFQMIEKREIKKIKKSDHIKICVNLFSSDKNKNINIDFIINILNNLKKHISFIVGFCGLEDELKVITQYINKINFKFIIEKELSNYGYFKLVEKYDFVLCNDSSTFHIADYYEKQCITFVNSESYVFQRCFDYWLNNNNNNLIFVMNSNYFTENYDISNFFKNSEIKIVNLIYKFILKEIDKKIVFVNNDKLYI